MARSIRILSPRATSRSSEAGLAPRVSSLDGKAVGFLRNHWVSLLVTMKRFEERLNEEHRVSEFVWKEKIGIRGTPQDELRELAEKCDVVINGLGG